MVDADAELERGLRSYADEAWADAHGSLSAADRARTLGAEDVERLATSTYMLGREDEFLALLERAHQAHLDAGQTVPALRCAFWIGIHLAQRGELGRAGGWLGRAQRLLDREGGDRVERGYLLLPVVFEQRAAGDWQAAAATAAEAAAIGERFSDPDLFALATHGQGHVLIGNGRFQEGVALLDEAMVSVTAGELSPIVSGIVYCGVILACQEAHEVRRAGEWTAALTRWCERQRDLVAFTGRCLVHRAEILQLHGEWPQALDEARRAGERCSEAGNDRAAGEARYRQGEVLRVLGDVEAAEDCFRQASGHGREPQPGLALLRLAQGNVDAAEGAMRRVADETAGRAARVAFLPAYVEVMIAVGDLGAARAGCEELDGLAEQRAGDALAAMAAQARGATELAGGDPRAALRALRRAGHVWTEVGAPYEAARVRALVGMACAALGDEDTSVLELDGARGELARLGAAPELERLESLAGVAAPDVANGLTERELEVLRMVAAGETNKGIAARLFLSDRTVDRHVSNIFAKLGVPTRTAATAYAYEHGLV